MPKTFGMSRGLSALLAVTLLVSCRESPSRAAPRTPTARPVVPNDNRTPSVSRAGDTVVFALDARMGLWRPDRNVDSALTVETFASTDSVPRVPGPLLRVVSGSPVEIRVTNHLADSTLVVHGLRPGVAGDDTVQVAAGASRIVRFVAGAPGTYLYWGRTRGNRMERSEARDGTLSGAIVIDAPGVVPDSSERIFVINTLDILPDSSKPAPRDDIFELALNGQSWPFTEMLHHTVGDTVRWRVLNATATLHPMHLHGFHFTALAKGNGRADTTYATEAQREGVTEFVGPGSTFRMRWVPTRAGSWLFHCHIIPHIVPFPVRADSIRQRMDAQMAGLHDAAMHAQRAMSGLVMGIEVTDRADAAAAVASAAPIAHRLRLFAQQASTLAVDDTAHARGYVLQHDDALPARDSIAVPGPLLLLTRGERTAITVVNHLPEPTSVHWHGMEIESYFDGVSGWSGADSRRAPLIAPNDSFVAVMTPPRAGTFMYHPHMDEEDQVTAGMFGPLIVLEPGERYDPRTDLVYIVGDALVNGKRDATLNGARTFKPMQFQVGVTYRLRFVNINAASPVKILLHTDSVPQQWTPRAKDGAELSVYYRREQAARLDRFGVGETYDFMWTPTRALRAELLVHAVDSKAPFRVPIVVRR